MSKPIKFYLEKMKYEEGKTFSPESLASFFYVANEFINRVVALSLIDGFDKNKPVQKMEFELKIKVDGKSIDSDLIELLMEKYPSVTVIRPTDLIELIKRRLKDK